MPKPKQRSKKKLSRRDRNEKFTSCEGCSNELDKKNFQYCICTRVRFCSLACQKDNPHKDCPGPPETRIDMNERLKEFERENPGGGTAAMQKKLMQDTVSIPSLKYVLSKEGINANNLSAWDYAALADEGESLGNQACAYLAGVRFKHRILSAPRLSASRVVANNRQADNIPVLESQELAFKYFEKAAKLGHGLSMQSLAECFYDGTGCKKNHRRSKQWLWRSCLHGDDGAIEMMDSKALLPLEIRAQIQMLDQSMGYLSPGQAMAAGGPNLAALLLVFHQVVEKENYTLPPFAAGWATATVNNRPTAGMKTEVPRTPLIGSEEIRKLTKKVKSLQARNPIQFNYGRRGTAKAATAQTYGADSRMKDNQVFVVPPFAACDERVTEEEHDEWCRQIQLLEYFNYDSVIRAFCVHSEKKGHRGGFSTCPECESEAIERLEAVSNGSVALSIEEDLSQRGQAAIFRSKSDGSLKMETWKTYAGGEAECVLAVLVASGMDCYVSPLFIAQDPNFYWPLIADHGCIRAALEFVAPHVDWDQRIGKTKDEVIDATPVMDGALPGKHMRKCGNSFCTKLEDYKAKGFLFCTRCQRRAYCCAECQAADWPMHKFECKAIPIVKEEGQSPTEESKISGIKHELKLEEGHDAVVHGLKAKPEYNGLIGTLGEMGSNGRIALTLKSEASSNILSIKPSNLYCLGVFCRKRRKKSRVFECTHGLEVCTECYFDFTTVNRLAKLKYSGQDVKSPFAIDQVNESYFSSFEYDDEDGLIAPAEGFPLESFGMENHLKQRLILKAILDTKTETSLLAAVAMTSYITHGSTKYRHLRAYTRLEQVGQML